MDTRTQLEAARTSVLAIPMNDQATLVVTGRDRVTWLNGLVTSDLVKRRSGDAGYGLVVGRNGKILSDASFAFDEPRGGDDPEARVFAAVPAAVEASLRAHFEHYLVMEDASVAPPSEGLSALPPWQVWSLHGPAAENALDVARSAGGVGGLLDRTGLGGALVFGERGGGGAVGDAIKRVTQGSGGAVGDEAGWDALRLERGVGRFGVDFDETFYPQEAALEKVAVSFDKGCYLGQEVVCMLELRGHVKRKLASLVVAGDAAPARGAVVVDEAGAPVGQISSAGWSPILGKVVALATLKRQSAKPGSRVYVGEALAEVVDRSGMKA